jgi:CheY-like chemotaxis protein
MVSEGGRGQGARGVVIVDHRAAAAGVLRAALSNADEFECVGAACTAAQAYAVVERTVPDLVVINLMLRGRTGLALTRRLRSDREDLTLVITAACPDVGNLAAAAVAGANGLAPTAGAVEELLSVCVRPAPAVCPSRRPCSRPCGPVRRTAARAGSPDGAGRSDPGSPPPSPRIPAGDAVQPCGKGSSRNRARVGRRAGRCDQA